MDHPEAIQPFRRPLKVRGTSTAKNFAAWLSQRSITPNQISVLSVVSSTIAGAFILDRDFIEGALFIQLRLVCNLLDGMVAMEGGKKTKSGELYNDIPDRISDVITLVCVGYLAFNFLPTNTFPMLQSLCVPLAWLAATLAVMTAYVRVLGSSMGAPVDFRGPMAKQQRMALITLSLVACSLLSHLMNEANSSPIIFQILFLVLIILNVGTAITVLRRISATHRWLESRN